MCSRCFVRKSCSWSSLFSSLGADFQRTMTISICVASLDLGHGHRLFLSHFLRKKSNFEVSGPKCQIRMSLMTSDGNVDSSLCCCCPHATSTTDGYRFTHNGCGAAGGLRGSVLVGHGRHQSLTRTMMSLFDTPLSNHVVRHCWTNEVVGRGCGCQLVVAELPVAAKLSVVNWLSLSWLLLPDCC